ncbi:putative exported protein [Bdellovibrio bacteriovorus str. Tiberius]|uniref:Putative exported protein n=2 Tax=Bdellovibrio bacteriovorus TaxID=959 RepID=K7YVR9_BDEBC|nr:putative exported protein [Bdellovibrio bacteriovorus str. Tiberius]
MYLSLKALPEYKSAATKAKVAFLPLLDPVTNTKENMLKVDLHKIEILNSEILIKKNALLHFPSYIFFKNGQLQGSFNPGYDSPEKFQHRLKEYFK